MKKDEHARKRKELTKRKIQEEKTAALNRLVSSGSTARSPHSDDASSNLKLPKHEVLPPNPRRCFC